MIEDGRDPADAKHRRHRKGPRKATADSLANAALFYLQRYASSAENLRRVLMRRVERSVRAHGTDRAEGAALVDRLIARYREAGLLDDGAYAEMRVQRLHGRGASLRAIRNQLAAKGVAQADIDEAIAALRTDQPDADLAAAVAYARRRRLGPWRGKDRAAHRERDLAALARRGFGYETAVKVVDAPDPDALAAALAGS